MPRYTYTAVDAATGRMRAGELESVTDEAAVSALKGRGLFPTALTASATMADQSRTPPAPAGRRSAIAGGLQRFLRAAGPKELTLFTRQLAALVRAGMPLVRSLDLLARQARRPRWREVIGGLADSIRAGGTLADGVARQPRIFEPLYLGMIRAGESGGTLDVILERLARYREKAGRLKARVQAAMVYPLVIMSVAGAIVAALLVLVVPKFEGIFSGVLRGAPLPALTQWVLGASRLAGRHWPAAIGVLAVLITVGRLLARTRRGARTLDRLGLGCPLLGALLLKTAVARFSRTLGSLLASGVPILEALELTRNTCGNRVVAEGLAAVQRRVREGEGVARPLAATGVFPPMVAGMVEVGEETGTLPEMLGQIADLYDDEVDTAVGALTSLIEPAMIVLMAFVVGTIVIALFLPIVRIIQMLGT